MLYCTWSHVRWTLLPPILLASLPSRLVRAVYNSERVLAMIIRVPGSLGWSSIHEILLRIKTNMKPCLNRFHAIVSNHIIFNNLIVTNTVKF
jgi:hypothetical protein